MFSTHTAIPFRQFMYGISAVVTDEVVIERRLIVDPYSYDDRGRQIGTNKT